MKRLAFADDVGAPYDSMLAFPAAAGQFINGALDTVMSITSRCARLRWTRRPVQMEVLWADRRRVPRRRLLPWEVQSTSRPNSHNSFPGGEEMYKLYSTALQLHSIHFGEDMKASENMEFISQGSTNNALCFIGPHRRFDPFARGFYSLEPGQGQCAAALAAASPPAPCARCSHRRARSCRAASAPTRFQAMRAGAGGRASRSRRREIRWSPSSWPRRRR